MSKYTKWVACWGNATSITDRREATFAKDLTLRYPIRMTFGGDRLRLRFSNQTGTEAVRLTKVALTLTGGGAKTTRRLLTFGGGEVADIAPGRELTSDEVDLEVEAGQTLDVSIYLGDFTQMNAGTLITGSLSHGQFAYGDHTEAEALPLDLSRKTNWFYFLNTIEIRTEAKNRALICYGDSITAQSWPDYLALRAWEAGLRNVAVIRRAVSGTRILRQYDCVTYQAYGLKGATRFPVEANAAGADTVIIQHGINDIIHPVGTDVNPFRPWSDMPTAEDLERGVETIYAARARELGMSVWSGTLLPIEGWRTYNDKRDAIRRDFNEWLRKSPIFDGCVDFDKAVRDDSHPARFKPGFDSGDHLHPSEAAYKAMAEAVPENLLRAAKTA